MKFQKVFHLISYLQYPFMLVALFFIFRPYLNGLESLKEDPSAFFQDVNSMLIFMGLGISFSSLQDVTKTQSSFSKKVWSDPVKGKAVIYMIVFSILIFLLLGLSGYFLAKEGLIREVSVGCIVVSLGMFGFLKVAIEVFENHRLDKK